MPEQVSVAGVEGEEAQAGGDADGGVIGGEMDADIGNEMRGMAPLSIDYLTRDDTAIMVVSGADYAATGLSDGVDEHLGCARSPEAEE